VQHADLGRRQAEDVGEDLLGVLAEQRRAADRQALERAQLDRRAGQSPQ
jgi:hypothetical protein